MQNAGFKQAVEVVRREVVDEVLVRRCGYRERCVHWMGYGQGGETALACALASSTRSVKGSSDTIVEFGSVISVGGPLLAEIIAPKGRSPTPVLLLGGSLNSVVTSSSLKHTRERFQVGEYHQWKGNMGDGMPVDREEMMPLMKVWGRRMRSVGGVPEGSVPTGG